MTWLDINSFGFLVVFLATAFLVGELLVKGRGLFALLGVALMAMYFSHHIDTTTSLWVIVLYAAGILLILLDGKVFSDGTVAIMGIVLMIAGVGVAAPGWMYGVLASMGVVLGAASSLGFLKVFPRRELWTKITLRDRLSGEEGYNSMNQAYGELVGKLGRAETDFRPTGTAVIDGEPYSATSGGLWVTKGQEIEVVKVDGTQIRVRPVASASEENDSSNETDASDEERYL
ncbi:NfeD-like partner-binding protein [Salsuginibacillus halophilus]|uniref:NfeD-like partner-binding protein n=1 Tax=Salsuginibacillus halophilus TaxID=517424 RepID=A0A2P8H7U3_9BACI|nr:NfeD family protein [Salsuginibacillus halophilus]PSL42307.1 NfeD-like partner-binding protein [Salsuginibacillus halophilus]